MQATLSEKNADYKIGGEFSNFEFAAQVAGLTPAHVMIAQVGIKLGRLMGLLQSNKDPNNESVADTIKDLHGYAAILHAWSMRAEHIKVLEREDALKRKEEFGCETPESHDYGCPCGHDAKDEW